MRHHLTYSIFYNKSEWYKLLDQLYIFLKSYGEVLKIFIKLSTQRGAHIELTVVVRDTDKMDCANYISNNLNKFLKERPSSNIGIEKQSQKHLLFEDFPNNTVHYGIHDCVVFLTTENKLLLKYHHEITLIVFSIFRVYNKDATEMTIEIVLQLLTLFCLTSNNSIEESILFFEELLKYECLLFDEKKKKRQLKTSSENFENNKEFILEYLESVLINKTEKNNEEWEKKWIELIQKGTRNQEKVKKNEFYKFLINTICLNMDFSNKIDVYVMLLGGLKKLK